MSEQATGGGYSEAYVERLRARITQLEAAHRVSVENKALIERGLLDKIERLTNEVNGYKHDTQRLLEGERALQKEIERLRALLKAKTTPGYELLAATIEKKEAEIERLRQENAVQNVALIDADDEIKKLEFAAVGLTDAWKASAAELERLRAAVRKEPVLTDETRRLVCREDKK